MQAAQRRRLPNRRFSQTIDLECEGVGYTTGFAKFSDGSLAEIFLTSAKTGSSADVAARDAAIATSIALQFGADLETIRKALSRDPRGNANGPLGVALDQIAAHLNDGR